jgi:hypothetical protein
MPAHSPDAHAPSDASGRAELPPERRLAAVADILARGLARILLAEESAAPCARAAQLAEITPESALLHSAGDALMVGRGEEAHAAEGGRAR